MIHPTRLLLSLLVGFTRLPPDDSKRPPQSSILRARKSGADYRLDTAVIRLRGPKEEVIDLIGVVHVANSRYYQQIHALLKAPSIVLFEMVGGESLGRWQVQSPSEIEGEPSQLDAPVLERPESETIQRFSHIEDRGIINRIYRLCADALGLELQTDYLDYQSHKFLHADLEYEQFEELRKKKGESMWKLLFASSRPKTPKTSKNKGLFRPWKFWKAGLSQEAKQLRQLLIRQLGSNPSFLDAFDSDSVILGKRNERCIEVLREQLNRGHEHMAILYGAAHLPDLIKRLSELGFQSEDQLWLEAWS